MQAVALLLHNSTIFSLSLHLDMLPSSLLRHHKALHSPHPTAFLISLCSRSSFCFRQQMSSSSSSSASAGEPSPLGPNVRFYLAQQRSQASFGRTGYHQEILAWDNQTLEREHNFIQWLFPEQGDHTRMGAGVNSRAYYLSPVEVEEFRRNREIQDRLLLSLKRMLAFYGLEYLEMRKKRGGKPGAAAAAAATSASSGGSGEEEGRAQTLTVKVIKREQDFEERMRNLASHTHNYLRISRIMTCLQDAGMHPYAFGVATWLFSEYWRFPKSTLVVWKDIAVRFDPHSDPLFLFSFMSFHLSH